MATTKILVALHADDASLPFVMRWTRRQGLSWLARCFLWQQAMPAMYTATWLFILACWTLPWFYGDFVPSGGVHGWFYMWGIVFDGEWLPIGDTWMYAAMHLSFDVAPFMLLMLWRSTNTADLVCPRRMPMNMSTQSPSSSSPIAKFLTFCHRWSMSIIACAFWVFRWKSVLSIAGFYGSIALVYNLLVWWMLAMAWMLLMEKDGVFALWRHAKAQHVPLLLDECPTCRQLAPDHPAFSPAASNASVDAISVILTAADHNSVDIDDRDQLSSSSASSIDTQRIAINSRKRSPSSQLGNTP
ncbi:hypothetical protein BC940DRAFT_160487 [Gongronella butleri]|nr:hypothetical protein BC940DRAFT_160487 [Gongronella butleri]